ncbi:DUF1922 domain-containing protein [Methanonatronarchaeum sp. AMET6-2]|uniref:DUF1922 domain-containing protein n=1 Tax=Methanonatronarchaeum sp. AMET6-2 TaxID=2933293 RepID=UPI0012256F1F|nr:DUF1922 domain-containing protein [Methanonatronarchaeum sp. AMET6-2]RZN63223.1 MAG: DUF1922 domain-containing protein [Methanonatronarchaeia archaeon]UOY10517.1 DUF1922 domain-containing protein [Methanonatronarchaeum sp. AMET6-2]
MTKIKRYIIFQCYGCGRYLYTEKTKKTRQCPCGKTVKLKKAKEIGETRKPEEAREAIQKLQEKESEKKGFFKYK